MRSDFADSIKSNQSDFSVDLRDEIISRLSDFYELVGVWNAKLHLVAPCSPSEFAVRHVLESLFMSKFLPENATFADIGAGAGFPSFPNLIVRGDLHGILIESNAKKCVFLREIVAKLNLRNRVDVINARFETVENLQVDVVACRAIEKFVEKLPQIVKLTNKSLLFGGENLREKLVKSNVKFNDYLLPQSEQRFLFVVEN